MAKYDHMLNWIASAFNLSIMIGNLTRSIPHNNYIHFPIIGDVAIKNGGFNSEERDSVPCQIGALCSRLLNICGDINDRFNNIEQRLDYLTQDEQYILNTYLDDAIEELKRSKKIVNHIKHLNDYIGEDIKCMEEIKKNIESVIVKEDN